MTRKPFIGLIKSLLIGLSMVITLMAVGYWLIFIMPAGQAMSLAALVKANEGTLTLCRLFILVIIYFLILLKIKSLLKREDTNARQRQFLLDLRWQALLLLLLFEILFGQGGLGELFNTNPSPSTVK